MRELLTKASDRCRMQTVCAGSRSSDLLQRTSLHASQRVRPLRSLAAGSESVPAREPAVSYRPSQI